MVAHPETQAVESGNSTAAPPAPQAPMAHFAKSPFDVADLKGEKSTQGGHRGAQAVDVGPARSGADGLGRRQSSLAVRLSGAVSGLTHRISHLASELNHYPLARVSVAQEFVDEKHFVTEEGKAGWWAVSAHLITVMFGAGVLGLPYAMSELGWVLGALMLCLATGTSAYSAFLLAELHTLRDGRRVRTLRALGEEIWGKRGRQVIVTLQMIDMVGGALIFSVAGGTSIMDIVHGCYGEKGLACDAHAYSTWPWTLCFGGAMILLSQFPDFHALTLVSLIGSVMPLLYAGVSFVSILVKGKADGVSYDYVYSGDTTQLVMGIFSGIGAMAYAFGGQVVQNEVTAMVRTPPPVLVSMRRALTLTYSIIGACYFAVAFAGYALYGNAVTGNITQSIPYQVPAIIANIGVLVHVGAAYQAFSMTVYLMMEEKVAQKKWMPEAIARNPWIYRFVIRTIYVCVITFFAALIPFFNQLSGLKGGACMVPLCFILPLAMWNVYNKDRATPLRRNINWLLVAIFALIAVVATVGSVYKIVKSASSFQLFA